MARPASLEWGIGGEFEELAALGDNLLWPCDGKEYEEMRQRRSGLLHRYAMWLLNQGRDRDSRAVSLVDHGRRWPFVSGDVIWWEGRNHHRTRYTASGSICHESFVRLVTGKASARSGNARFYDYVIDAILDMARATLSAEEARQEENRTVDTLREAYAGS